MLLLVKILFFSLKTMCQKQPIHNISSKAQSIFRSPKLGSQCQIITFFNTVLKIFLII